MKLTVIGAGYVGLVSGVCLADLGIEVTCVDKDQNKINALMQGEVPIYEPGLDALVIKNMQQGRLHFTTTLKEAVAKADIVMIAVGTPPDQNDAGKADLRYVFAAAEEIATALKGYSVIVTKSTVPVGTNAVLEKLIARCNPHAAFDIASNPEFLREGSAIIDFMKPDRILIGTHSDKAEQMLSELYRGLTHQGFPLLRTDIETAEMIKYASNAFLATKIAFINEMADICERVGANVEMVAKGMGMDKRIGDKFLQPGPGFGGSCFPKDTMALTKLAEEVGVSPKIVETVIDSNACRREAMAARIIAACAGSVHGKTIAVLGLTFKANTDDMRESPALSIIPLLMQAGAIIRAHDPEGMPNAQKLLPESVHFCKTPMEACAQADAVAILTEWEAYKTMPLGALKAALHTPCMIDMRNLFEPSEMQVLGFDYYSIGRKTALGFSQAKTAKTA